MIARISGFLHVLVLLFKIGCSTCLAQCAATFEEENGLVVIEAESPTPTAQWTERSDIAGYTGASFLEWTGPNYFGSPGNGLRQYTVNIVTPGTFRFQWRSRILDGNSSTEHNDAWLRMPDATSFFAKKGSSILYPKGIGLSPTPNGSGADGWFKIYMNQVNWSWHTSTSDNDPHNIYATFASPGIYTIEVSGRSAGYAIDRMVLSHSSVSPFSAQDTNLVETLCIDDDNTSTTTSPPSSGTFGVDGFVLVDADKNTDIPGALECNPVNSCFGSATNFNIRATVFGGNDIKSVFLSLAGPISDSRTEQVSPYAVFGDDSGNYNGFPLAVGSYSMVARAFNQQDEASDDFTFSFEVNDVVVSTTMADLPGLLTTVNEVDTTTLAEVLTTDGPDTTTIIELVTTTAQAETTTTSAANEVDTTTTAHITTTTEADTTTTLLPDKATSTAIVETTTLQPTTTTEQETTTTTTTTTLTEIVTTTTEPAATTMATFGVDGFVLVDADTDSDIPGALQCNPVNSCFGFASNFNIRATVFGDNIKSVYIALGGPINASRTEEASPFAVFGDNGGNYIGYPLKSGQYKIAARAFDNQGEASQYYALAFEVRDIDMTTSTKAPNTTSEINEPVTTTVTGGTTTLQPDSTTEQATTTMETEATATLPQEMTSTITEATTTTSTTTSPGQTTTTVTQEPIFINCGSNSSYFDGENTWVPDRAFLNGDFDTYQTTAGIANTPIQKIYKTERYNKQPSAMKYSIPLQNGRYDVLFHFAELYLNSEGQRIFSVELEGDLALIHFDIYKEAGGHNRALVKQNLNIPVTDGMLDIEFLRFEQNPTIHAIEIRPTPLVIAPTREPTPSPTVQPTPQPVLPTLPPVAPTPSPISSENYGVEGFALVDAIADSDVIGGFDCLPDPVCTGATVMFNIRVDTFGNVSSVWIKLSGSLSPQSRVESTAPYTLVGDAPGVDPDYYGMALPSGDYTIEAIAFSPEGVGSQLASLNFTIS